MILKPFLENIEKIKDEIYLMGDDIVRANKISLSALKEKDMSMLSDFNLSIKSLSIKSNEIDNMIVKTLALYSPEAKDLREMVSYLKVTNELVRAGSNSKTFAKSFKKSFTKDLNKDAILEYAVPLLKASNSALETALSLLKETNPDELDIGYKKVIVEESKTDDLYAMVEKNILKLMSKNLDLSKEYFDILSSLRRLERTADRAATISHLLIFAEIGGEIRQAQN